MKKDRFSDKFLYYRLIIAKGFPKKKKENKAKKEKKEKRQIF